MAKTVPSLILVILVSSSVLLLIWYLLPTTTLSPFLIAAGIVASVALLGACFSFFLERKKSQPQQA